MSIDAYHALVRAPDTGAPLVFAFHGTGGDETQFFGLVRQIAPRAGVVSPRGDVSERGAARFFRRTGEGVYDMADLAVRTEYRLSQSSHVLMNVQSTTTNHLNASPVSVPP